MKFISTPLAGSFLVEFEPVADDRGFFARCWSRDEFESQGLDVKIAACSISFNERKGTLRGMHHQDPFPEAKLIRCSSGAIHDVIVDLRPSSSTYLKWFAAHLTSENRHMLYVPQGFAHGFQTLVDRTEIFYQISEAYKPEYARGIRWNDPILAIDWPIQDPIVSLRDRSFPDFKR